MYENRPRCAGLSWQREELAAEPAPSYWKWGHGVFGCSQHGVSTGLFHHSILM